MIRINLLLTVVVLFAIIPNVCAQDWPQYFGPNRNSTSPQKGILRTWPASGPEILWTVNVGPEYGGPVVKDGKVYLLDRDDKTGDIMRCFDFSNGKELWKSSYDAPGSVMFPGSCSVPAVDGKYAYSCGHNSDLYCIDINTHKPIWNRNIWTDFGGDKLPVWAITQCPLIYGDLVIVSSQSTEAGVVAYYKLTGKIVWKTLREPLFDKVNMILADGVILATDGRTSLYLMEPSPSGFKPPVTAEVLKTGGNTNNNQTTSSRMGGGSQNWAPIALADGKFLIWDQSRLMCVSFAK